MLHETLEYLAIAFVSSAVLILLSMVILQSLIRRPADYYSAEELRQEELMLGAAAVSITDRHKADKDKPAAAAAEHTEPAETPANTAVKSETDKPGKPQQTNESGQTGTDKSGKKNKSGKTNKSKKREKRNKRNKSKQSKKYNQSPKPVLPDIMTAENQDVKMELRVRVKQPEITNPEYIPPDSEAAKIRRKETGRNEDKPVKNKPQANKRKPSMKMRKDELVEIATLKGIEIPEDATKRIILDLIYQHDRRKQHQ